jgi:hypothetical protein
LELLTLGTEEIKLYCMPKPLIRIGISELGGLAWTAGFELQAMC